MKLLGVALLAAGLLAGCSGGEESAKTDQKQQDIREMVNDYSKGKVKGHNASITSHELIIAKGEGDKQVIDLSEEEFFVSIAPYEDQTHP
ncbi:hypothetical protein EJA10_08590 [Mesobacillus subterraneus]|uniref:Uncharacterized protein n=2 Tax=Mesobacillus subterraneus TaxID=285983 RepID=A0A427TU08_9BACI|nr:hypothetical protein EJA10_08590 [Mesobacillus subterraneus]